MPTKKAPALKDSRVMKTYKEIADMTSRDKDLLLAVMFVFLEDAVEILNKVAKSDKDVKLTKKQKSKLEHIVSIGPSWLNYTVKKK